MYKILKNKKGGAIADLIAIFPLFCILMLFIFDSSKVIIAKLDCTTLARDTMRMATYKYPDVALEESKNYFNMANSLSQWKGAKYTLKSINTGSDWGDLMKVNVCGKVNVSLAYIWGSDSTEVCTEYTAVRTLKKH